MPTIWRNCIEAGTQIFADCPARYREEVLSIMRQDVIDGRITKFGKMTPGLFEDFTDVPYEV